MTPLAVSTGGYLSQASISVASDGYITFDFEPKKKVGGNQRVIDSMIRRDKLNRDDEEIMLLISIFDA